MGTRHIATFADRQRGLSLVELMVALLIALVLTAGVIQIFLGSSQTYRMNDGMSRVQENLRFGMEVLQRDVRMAGFTGCTRNVFNWLDPAGAGYVDFLMGGSPVIGWDYAGTGPGATYVVGTGGGWPNNGTGDSAPAAVTANALPGSDIVILNRAQRLDVVLQGNPSPPANTINAAGATGIRQGTIIAAVTSNCSGGDLWQKTNNHDAVTLPKGSGGSPGNINPSGGFTQIYDDNASIYEWVSTAYYIRGGASGEPALYQQRLDTGGAPAAGWPALELVEGVENMQILYGTDTNGDRRVDDYVTANAVTDWEEVISVRLSLLLRTPAESAGQTDTRTYTLLGTEVDPPDDRRIRQVSTSTIGVRNRLD